MAVHIIWWFESKDFQKLKQMASDGKAFPRYSVSQSIQLLNHVWLFVTPWIAACQAPLSITNSRSLLMSIESVMPSSHLILCRPLLLLPPIPPTIRAFSNESTLLMRWPKYWSFSFSISPSNEHPGQISFRTDWLDLLAVQGTLKSLLQHHSSNASIFWCSAFFTVQLSYPYMTTGKSIALTRQTFIGKVMSLLFFKPGLLEICHQTFDDGITLQMISIVCDVENIRTLNKMCLKMFLLIPPCYLSMTSIGFQSVHTFSGMRHYIQ